jgi:hypothetical protein
MVSIYIVRPGCKYGGAAARCEHVICRGARADAAALCRICGEPIGFYRRFYVESGAARVHENCAEDEKEERRSG